MKAKTLLVIFLVCILVADVVLGARCGGGRRRKIKKIVRKLRPAIRVLKIITRMRTRPRPPPCNNRG
uniref:Uncharacterized protein n=1 Tax=Isometrus maculatus TaxID=497827 RepID=A0A0U1SK74_ISOMC|nr:hypothetical protein [Isometrus maculatus]